MGFNNVIWDARQISDSELELIYRSKMEKRAIGMLDVLVIYKLTDNNELEINYTAGTNKAAY